MAAPERAGSKESARRKNTSGPGRNAASGGSYVRWSKAFLAELAATSNVSAAARAAGVTTAKVYETRRRNAEFYRAWQVALCEGYELLEIELLQRLREGEIKPAAGAKDAVRSFDNAAALRLLGAHKESAARARAVRDHADTEAILASINAKLERMRRRSLAGAAGAADADDRRTACDGDGDGDGDVG